MANVSAGYNWSAGETVTATKLNNAAAPTVAVADGEVTTAKIADANVTTAKIADSNVTTAKLAASAVTLAKLDLPTGFPIQVIQAVKDTTQDITTNGVWTDISGLSLTINRQDTAGKVRVQAMIHGSAAGFELFFRIVRGSTVIGVPSSGFGSRSAVTSVLQAFNSSTGSGTVPIDFIDDTSAISTASLTYKIQAFAKQGGFYTNYINKANTDTDADERPRAISTITLTELAS
jgi:hypothetical protein